MNTVLRVFPLFILLLFPWVAAAKPLKAEEVPAPLKPWVDWVSKGNEHKRCPFLYSGFDRFQCAWPGDLHLAMSASGGEFSQNWQVFEESWLLLPGEANQWPTQVTLDGKPAVVISRNGKPAIQVPAGSHTLQGRFRWNEPPKSLALPDSTVLISVTLNGSPVAAPRVEQGRLWLQSVQPQKVEDRFELQVFRRIDDAIPARVTFYLDMQVAGGARETVLDMPLTEEFVPLTLQSALPARLDSGHKLRVQIKPGHWALELTVRHIGPLSSLGIPQTAGKWVDHEVWVFNAQPQYRIVNLTGVNAIDPQQTLLPEDWKRLPAYRLQPGDAMTFVEERRGDPDPGADNLSLQRNLWLDFTGAQYTIQDRISGLKKTAWRLEMNPPIALGQVNIDGDPQYITRLQNSDRTGVEVRQGNIQLTADSVLRRNGALPATGWNQHFDTVSTALHIPPGYRVLSVAGADHVSATWLSRWTLLDIFLVLLITAAVGKLWGKPLGALTLITLALIYHEPGAPVWIWLSVVLGFALLRVLPTGRFRHWALLYRNVSLIVLVLIAVPFFIQQIRASLYPQLEHYGQIVPFDTSTRSRVAEVFPAQTPGAPALGDAMVQEESRQSKLLSRSMAPMKEYASKPGAEYYDPGALLQTGPGLPQWGWNRVDFSWSGPVDSGQTVHITYLGPFANSLLGWLRVILVSTLVLGLLGLRLDKQLKIRLPSYQSFTSVALLSITAVLVPGVSNSAHAEFPSKTLLDELQNRLFAPPDCLPQCAEVESMSITLSADKLKLELIVHSEHTVAIPLPGGAEQWAPQKIAVNNQRVQILSKDPAGVLWFPIGKGRHIVQLEGVLGGRDTVEIPLPLKPHSVSVSGDGWDVAGVHADGSADTQLQLTRQARQPQQSAGAAAEFNAGSLPPFVEVERNLRLGLDWRAQTRVSRLSPPGTAIVLRVPLLAGESVTSEGVRIENGHALINMGASQTEAGWESVLPMKDELMLTAAQTTQWTEVWNLDVSPIWHMQYHGIPVIRHQQADRWLPQWRPWPGEQVTFNLSRPQGVEGQTTTIDHSRLEVSPGIRITNMELTFNLRSSQGAQHPLRLPDECTLQAVAIDDIPVPLRLQDRTLMLPVKPGEQRYRISWQEPRGIETRFQTSAVDIGAANVNHHIALSVPSDRMIFAVNGPAMGPAVLFWGVLIVFLLLSLGLAQLKTITPLRYWQWALLSIGLVPVSVESALVVIGWFFVTGLRCRLKPDTDKWQFNAYQILLVAFTLVTAGTLIYAVSRGLLGSPDMQIAGNGSTQYMLNWYQDSNTAQLPSVWMFTIPMFVYRILMLLWALWLAFSVIHWSKWFWQCFSSHGYWRSIDWKKHTGKDKSLPVANTGGGKYLTGGAGSKTGDDPSH